MAFSPSKGRNTKMTGMDPLDMTPIMNLFITIIPMLLTMLVTLQLSYISLNLAATSQGGGGNGAGAGGEKIKVVRVVLYNNRIEVQEEGAKSVTIPTYMADGIQKYDFISLDATISGIKQRNPNLYNIKVVPYPDVDYDTLVRSIDVCKLDGFPNVTYSIPETRYYEATN
jgi:hypothetical protein